MLNSEKLRLGIVGCGQIVRQLHLPAIALVPAIQVAVLIDRDIDLAQDLAAKFDLQVAISNDIALCQQVDAALIALPHALHAPIATTLLNKGLHVLVEKPMATSVQEAQAMIEAAQQADVVLAVGLMRHFYSNMRFVKRALDSDMFGAVKRVWAEESVPFDRIQAPAFYVDRNTPGSGVLADTGAHSLDLLLWWFGDVSQVSYWDDNRGGVEANCRLELEFESGVSGIVELSRMRRLRNIVRIETDQVMLEVPTLEQQHLRLFDPQQQMWADIDLAEEQPSLSSDPWVDYFARQWQDFAEAVLQRRDPAVPGEQGARTIELIERCRSSRQPLAPAIWESFQR